MPAQSRQHNKWRLEWRGEGVRRGQRALLPDLVLGGRAAESVGDAVGVGVGGEFVSVRLISLI